jgi:hypothetical protein
VSAWARRARQNPRVGDQTRQVISNALNGQFGLEADGGRTHEGVAVRVAQRILAMAVAILHNNKTGAPVTRSLIAYDH